MVGQDEDDIMLELHIALARRRSRRRPPSHPPSHPPSPPWPPVFPVPVPAVSVPAVPPPVPSPPFPPPPLSPSPRTRRAPAVAPAVHPPSPVAPPSPRPVPAVAPAVPLYTLCDSGLTSLTVVRGARDYSLGGHPKTEYMLWWSSPTAPDTRQHFLTQHAPYPINRFMRTLMGPQAEAEEDIRFSTIQNDANAMGIAVWGNPARMNFGMWDITCISTLNAAHHLRLTALSGDICAAKVYYTIYFFHVHGLLRRHEAARYIVRYYAGDSLYLPDDTQLRVLKGLAHKGKRMARELGLLAGSTPQPLLDVYHATKFPFLHGLDCDDDESIDYSLYID
ncbi:uncharacterized protein BXZ73DRAFT_107877 [Epithele typhae]|uniref:uncharacterized protein n=1 Tax=Epithele typhae TaxID=378194 RepID=UPI00200892B6|nr:uncharacterized protein BXZ73DRAFT_107877 [Epithele typhae]KAH9911692.1 hypothetical protein BXZ73DRAFT_107877 [Epithele typhae]